MKKLKWAFLCATAMTFVFGLSVFAWASRDIPTAAIHELRHGYVATHRSQGEVNYRFVQSPPSNWTTLDAVSPYAREVIILAEDARFYRHPGFDAVEIRASLFDALLEFKRPRGASTITQQLAKNLFLTNDYSFWRKLREIAIARELESTLSKDKILELYLNVVEYGEGLYGIGDAADYYFEESASDLGLRESAFLAMLLPSPRSYSECFKKRELTGRARSTIMNLENAYLARRDLVFELCGPTCGAPRPCSHARPRMPEMKPTWMSLPEYRYP